MNNLHHFDADGYYTGTTEVPVNPVSGKPFDINEAVATLDQPPAYEPAVARVRRVDGTWVVEVIPVPDPVPEPVPEPEPTPEPEPEPQYPRFYGNEKLDMFTPAEQLAIVTATMNDPVVKLTYDRLLGAAYLTYEDPETEYGLQLMLDKGLITQDRKVAIVAAMQP